MCVCRCEQLVASYLEDESPEARLHVGGDMRKIQLCFSLLKVCLSVIQLVLPSWSALPCWVPASISPR